MIEPVDPFERGELDVLEAPPRPTPVDHFGLVEAVDRLGERVVIQIADAADGGLDASFREALGVAQRKVLRAPVAVVDEAGALRGRRSCRACSRASSTKPA